ncbi:MAG: inactive transglutaminase family protein [Syntrophales bacterium]|nr:inactive transglutaminase family protein [Syntrophales bacterium]
MNRTHLYVLAFILAAVGLGLVLYKVLVLNFPLSPGAESYTWNVEAKVTFMAGNEPVKLTLFTPRTTRRYAITNEAFVSQGYGLVTAIEDANRQATWSIRQARGLQTLYYRAEVVRVNTRDPINPIQPPTIDNPSFEGADLTVAQALVDHIRQRSADHETMAAELLKRFRQPQPDDNLALLLGKNPTEKAKMELAAKVLALAGVPVRVVHGIALKEQKERLPVVHWLEIYNQKWWQAIDPATGAPGIPDTYLAWWRGPLSLARLTGGSNMHVTLSVTRELEAAISTAVVRGQIKKPLLLNFSLLSLPLHSQQVYRILLMVPVGGFLLVILRNIIGISTFGTFMPVLIALAFRETQLLWGVVLFSSLVALGLTIRFYLDRLKLLLVPRLAAVLIVVVILMALMSIFTNRLGIERGLSVALFPMVILTMTIERMSIVWEERGPYEAIKQGLGSLGAAALAYLVMQNREVQHLFFVFPELLLVLLAATLLLGRYSGYRLVELWRFKVLGHSSPGGL